MIVWWFFLRSVCLQYKNHHCSLWSFQPTSVSWVSSQPVTCGFSRWRRCKYPPFPQSWCCQKSLHRNFIFQSKFFRLKYNIFSQHSFFPPETNFTFTQSVLKFIFPAWNSNVQFNYQIKYCRAAECSVQRPPLNKKKQKELLVTFWAQTRDIFQRPALRGVG